MYRELNRSASFDWFYNIVCVYRILSLPLTFGMQIVEVVIQMTKHRDLKYDFYRSIFSDLAILFVNKDVFHMQENCSINAKHWPRYKNHYHDYFYLWQFTLKIKERYIFFYFSYIYLFSYFAKYMKYKPSCSF